MEIFFSILLFSYVSLLLLTGHVWKRIPAAGAERTQASYPGVSIVIAARNEESNIEKLVQSLNSLSYPKRQLEVIMVNDASEDRTGELMQQYTSGDLAIKTITLHDDPEFSGSYKKRALTEGIGLASHGIIVTTDADCQFHPQWISSLIDTMQEFRLVMATGPVQYASDQWMSRFLNIELSSLVAVGAVSIWLNHPNMCNGANLVFQKHAFDQVDGYRGYEQVISGDDEFLLEKIFNSYPGQVQFVKLPEAIVVTDPPTSWHQFINQRKRWSSKWKYHKSISTRMLAVLVFVFHLSFTVAIIMAIAGWYSWRFLLVQAAVKLLAEFTFTRKVLAFMGERVSIKWILIMQLLYSLYVVMVSVVVQFSGFSWKNRKYND